MGLHQMPCGCCHELVPIVDIKYVAKDDGSLIPICSLCRTRIKGGKGKSAEPKSDVKKGIYFCTRCRYKFQFNPDTTKALKCPYCGKPDKLEELAP